MQKAKGEKCPRCWKYKELVSFKEDLPCVCERCKSVLDRRSPVG